MLIDRCICFQKRFADLKRVAEATGAHSLSALQQETTFGLNCKLCHPYVRRMLRTGETEFRQIISQHEEPERF